MKAANRLAQVVLAALAGLAKFARRERIAVLLALTFHSAGPFALFYSEFTYGTAIAVCLLLAIPQIKTGGFAERAFKNTGVFFIMFAPGWSLFLLVLYSFMLVGLPLMPDARHDPGLYIGLFGAIVGVPSLFVGIGLYLIGSKLEKSRTPLEQ